MVSSEKIAAGAAKYIETEILPHLPPVKAICLGTAVALYLRQMPSILAKIPKSMGVVDDSGLVDIEAVREALKANVHGAVNIDLPLIGTLTLDPSEINKLYRYIMES